jgi:hypothetical protein
MFPLDFLNPAALWPSLSVASKFLFLILAGASVGIFCRLLFVLFRYRNAASRSNPITSTETEARTIDNQLTGARQLQFFVSYLFAFYFFFQLPDAFHTLSNSKSYPIGEILQRLGVQFAYATDVCFVLLILHTAQWIVSARLAAASRRLA